MSYESNKELLTGGFQSPYDICAVRRVIVRVSRSQDDVTRMDTETKPDLNPCNLWLLLHQPTQYV
jgi:hypothetical protein